MEQAVSSVRTAPIDPLLGAAPAEVHREPFTTPALGFRPEIEGLRAIAVVLVVLYHADLGPFSGGFIGVDVFFVVSGFLITSLLLGEVARTGTIALPMFWARRARRLLPASSLVIVATLLVAQWWYDPLLLASLERDALAAAAFIVNYVFAFREAHGDGGYFDTDLAKSPLLHFWSLAVEEQFYLIWPFVLWGLARTARRLRQELVLVMVVLWVASIIGCVWLTGHSQPWAFYSLPTRAWELLTGALLAVSITSLRRLPRPWVLPLAGGGLLLILVAAVVYDGTTTFPGIAAAVPVAGAAMVIVAGSALGAPAALRDVLGARPMLWTGQRSYAIYLWHWPALVLVGTQFGPLSAPARAGVVLASVVIAAISYRLVEDPARHSAWIAANARRSLAVGGALLVVVAVVATFFLANPPTTSGGEDAAALTLPDAAAIAASPTTVAVVTDAAGVTALPTTVAGEAAVVGPETEATDPGLAVAGTDAVSETTVAAADLPPALVELVGLQQQLLDQGMTTSQVPSNLRPSLTKVRGDLPDLYDNGCVLDPGHNNPPTCVFGDASSAVTVAVLGDSHAAQWFPAMQQLALDHHWRLLYFAKKGCPPSEQPLRNGATSGCDAWRAQALEDIVAARPALTIFTGYHYEPPDGSGGGNALWRNGMTATMTKLGDLAAHVLILGDTPTQNANVPDCLAEHLKSVGACVSPRSYAVRGERLAVERDVAAQFGASTIDTSDWLCTAQACPIIIGDLLVYRDRNHLTPAAATSLVPLLDAAVTPLVAA